MDNDVELIRQARDLISDKKAWMQGAWCARRGNVLANPAARMRREPWHEDANTFCVEGALQWVAFGALGVRGETPAEFGTAAHAAAYVLCERLIDAVNRTVETEEFYQAVTLPMLNEQYRDKSLNFRMKFGTDSPAGVGAEDLGAVGVNDSLGHEPALQALDWTIKRLES